jgi:hypothetical protein
MTRRLRRPSRLRGCNRALHSVATRLSHVPLTYTLAPHARLPGRLQMIASRRRTELDGTLARRPDGVAIRITSPTAYCRIT